MTTSARIFYALITAAVVTGLPTSFVPGLRELVATAWLVGAALVLLGGLVVYVVEEIRWSRRIDRIIAEPIEPAPADDVLAGW